MSDCDISGFQKNGIDAINGNGATSGVHATITLTVFGGSITGAGPTDAIAQNGIVLWNRGGGTVTGSVTGANISNFNYAPDDDTAAGVLAYGGGILSSITNVRFTDNEYNISTTAGSPAINAANNYWGSVTGPATSSLDGAVSFSPWCETSDCSITRSYNAFNETSKIGYNTIAEAIANAGNDDTINVAAGTYSETLHINKPLILNGAQAGNDARTRSGDESVISSGDPSGSVQIGPFGPITGTVTIDGFTIGGSPAKAIHVRGVTDNVVVKNNIIESASVDGINLWQAKVADVEQNLVKGAGTSGITGGNDANTADTNDGVLTRATISNNKVENSQFGITGYLSSSMISDNEVIGTDSLANGSGIGGQFYATSIAGNAVHGYTAGAGVAFDNTDYTTNLPSTVRADSSAVTVAGNEIYGNAAGIYVNQPIDAETVVHNNSIYDNSMAAVGYAARGSGTLDATDNYWGAASGPAAGAVSADVSYRPWLLEANGDTYDETIALTDADAWALISAPKLLSEAPAVVDNNATGTVALLIYGNGAFGSPAADNADIVKPISAFYTKVDSGGGVGFRYADTSSAPSQTSKDLVAGWNLVGTNNSGTVQDEFSSIQNTETVAGMITLYVPDTYNARKDSGSNPWASDGDRDLNANPITGLPAKDLSTHDGYWVFMNAAKSFTKNNL